MLSILIDSLENKVENEIVNPNSYFDGMYEKEWLNNQVAKDIIKGIDNTEHIKDNYLESPVLGAISPRDLSTGCKATLILLNETEDVFVRGERFGDNCAEWILKIAEAKDIAITLNHVMHFPGEFEIKILNSGKVVHNQEELLDEIVDYATSGNKENIYL